MGVKALLVIVFGVVLIVVGGYLSSTYGPRLQDIETARIKGELIPFAVDEQKPFDVQMGGVHGITTIDRLKTGYDLRSDFNFNDIVYPFEVSFNDGRLLVSAEIRNTDGEKVATIAKNQWGVNPSPVIAFDRNYNSYAFEVIAPNQVPTLQVVMTPENRIFVGGVFYNPNGTMLAMLNGTTILGPDDNDIKGYNQTIFQYPSDSHLGELVANSQYAFASSQNALTPATIIMVGLVLLGTGTFITLVVSVDSFKRRNVRRNNRRKPEKSKQKSKKRTSRFSTKRCEQSFYRLDMRQFNLQDL